jgi:class 3 adenylate cyclase
MEQMLAPREMEVTTLFCDLRDYSQLVAQSTSALLAAQREVAAALNVMSSAITDRDGVVSGFRGDAVLGFWGWPQPHDNQITLAARAALAVQARLGTRSGVGGVALAHGTAVVGRLGPHELAAVDVFGPVVDLTYRLEALARAFGVPILVSRAIADGVAAADPYGREMRTRPLGSVCRKGFPEMLSVHELYSAANPSIQDWQTDAWAEALDLFTQGQWADAYDLLSAQFPDDPAARCLMRVMDQTGRRPGAEWKGAFEVPASAE